MCISSVQQTNRNFIKFFLSTWTRRRSKILLSTFLHVRYVDSDYAGCKDMCQSIEGNIFIVAGGLVLWESKWQKIVTLSIVEVEYMAFTRATAQVLYLTKFFNKIGLPIKLSWHSQKWLSHYLFSFSFFFF